MLTFQLDDGNKVEIDRAAVEEKLLLAVIDRLDEAREKDPGMYTVLKQAVNMVLMMGKIDLKVPKGQNPLEFLIAYYASLGLDVLEKEPLQVAGRIVSEADGQTS